MTPQDEVAKVAELVDRARICMLTTMTDSGHHLSRPMAVQEVEFDGDLWFFAEQDSAKVEQIRTHPQVNVAFSNSQQSEWTSIAGTASITTDEGRAEQLWSALLNVWFPDGPATPGLVLIRVHADSAGFWDGPNSKAAQLIGAVRAVVSGDPDKLPGRNEEVSL